jgi:hypothetical protein
MVLKQLHHSQTIDLLLLIKRNKLKVFWIFSNVSKGTLNCIQIVSTNRCVLSSSTKSIVKLLLSSDKSFIGFLIESNVSKDSSSNKWPDLVHLNIFCNTEGSMTSEVVGALKVTEGVLMCPR